MSEYVCLRTVVFIQGAASFHHHLREAISREFASLENDLQGPAYHAEYIAASSYSNDTSSGDPELKGLLPELVKGKHIIIVEDLIDTGATVRKIKHHLIEQEAASIRVATLLTKR